MGTAEHYTTTSLPSVHEVITSRDTDKTSYPSTSPIYGIAPSAGPSHHHHPTQNIHDAWAAFGPISRSFSGRHTAHTPNTSRFPASSFAAHASRNPAEEDLFYHGQAITQGQYSTSSPSIPHCHLSQPAGHRQVNLAIPEIAGNAARPQNIYSYSRTSGSNNNIQVDLLQTSFLQEPYHNTEIFHSPQSRNHTQGSTDFVPAGNSAIESYFPSLHSQQKKSQSGPASHRGSASFGPAGNPSMGSDFVVPYSPPRQSSNNHTPHHDSWSQWQGPVDCYPSPAGPTFRSGPGQPWSFVAPEPHLGMSRGEHYPHLPVPTQPRQDLPPDGNHCQGTLHGHSSLSHTHTHAQPEEYLIPCCWRHDDNIPCKFRGSKGALRAHILDHLPGPQGADIICRWEGCDYSKRGQPTVNTMRRDSVWRHTLERHLNVKCRKKERVQGS